MKNVMKTMMVVGAFALFAFAPVNVKEACPTTVVEPVEEVCVEVVEDALWCKVTTSDGRTVSCILCNCSKLAKAAK